MSCPHPLPLRERVAAQPPGEGYLRMTLHRTIKWLTILMLVLSLAITGAWVWAGTRPTFRSTFGTGTQSAASVWIGTAGQDVMLQNEAVKEGREDEFQQMGVFGVNVIVRRTGYSSRFPTPLWTHESVEIKYWPKSAEPSPPSEIGDERVLAAAQTKLHSATTEVIDALSRGPGKRQLLFLPGVAERVRFWSPYALGLVLSAGVLNVLFGRYYRRTLIRKCHCPNCDYDLRGINTTTCPECGKDRP